MTVMLEYRIQRKETDGKWVMDAPAYICYTRKEMAQEAINKELYAWEIQKAVKNPQHRKADIMQYSNPENWRIVQRSVTEWEPI